MGKTGFIHLHRHCLSFTDKVVNLKISSQMSNNKPTYEEVQARCDDLQGQVIRFLKVEQDLIRVSCSSQEKMIDL